MTYRSGRFLETAPGGPPSPGRARTYRGSALCLAFAVLLVLDAPAHAAKMIDSVPLGLGREEGENVLTGPVYLGSEADPIYFAPVVDAVPRGAAIMRFPRKNGKVRELKYRYGQGLDLGALLTTSMVHEAGEMGLTLTSDSSVGWKVSGRIEESFFEYKIVPFGPILFYGRVRASFVAEHADGRRVEAGQTFLSFVQRYNAGFGAADEVTEALAELYVETGQEAVALLNRLAFGAPPHPTMSHLLGALKPTELEEQALVLRQLGLSGLEQAAPVLLRSLDTEAKEDGRIRVLDALAVLGVPEASGQPIGRALADRYAGEGEDGRFFVWKALAYLDSPELEELAKRWSKVEKNLPIRRLAADLLAGDG